MARFPLHQPEPSGPPAIFQARRRLRPGPVLTLGLYAATFLCFQLVASALSPSHGMFLWNYPAALSVTLMMVLGPRVLPVVILASLPLDLLLRPMGLSAPTLLGISAASGVGQALAVMAFKRMGCSPRLRRVQDAAGFLGLAFLGPLLAALPIYVLLRGSGVVPAQQLLATMRILFLGNALGVMMLGPALLVWIRPILVLGPAPIRRAAPAFRPWEFLLQCGGVILATAVVARFSEPGTLHLKYLLFLPLFWMVVRGGLRVASLGFLVLSVALTAVILQNLSTSQAVLGAQAFLVVLFGAALFLASAVDAHAAARDGFDREARRLNQLVAGTGAIPWEMDLDTGRCGHLGFGVEPLLGLPQEAWRKQPFWGEVVHPDDQLAFLKFLLDVSQPDRDHQLEFRLRTPDGGEHWVRAVGGLEPSPAQGRVMGFLFDIHSHKRAEENALRTSLKEKDLLLREIHHRVKNNLQVVSSLLRLQASTQADPAVQRALQEAQERIQAIALIHQRLKHAPDYSQLDLPGYVRTLAERLVRSYASVPTLIDLRVQVAAVEIGPDAPVPLGLILNELVANALQHAFPPGEGGSLDIEIAPDKAGWITVRVADSGQGLPEAVDLGKGGLGFQLVQALTDQLGGVLELERRRGASFLLRFPPALRHP